MQEVQARSEQHTQSCNSVEGTYEGEDSYAGKALGGGLGVSRAKMVSQSIEVAEGHLENNIIVGGEPDRLSAVMHTFHYEIVALA
ncbi:hypothetical protein FF1_000041 [Malus domestica]